MVVDEKEAAPQLKNTAVSIVARYLRDSKVLNEGSAEHLE